MISITKIEQQKKNKDRYNVYIDESGEEHFFAGVDQELIIKNNIKNGTVFEKVALEKIIFEDKVKKALSLSYNYLSYRMRSQNEIIKYLETKDFPQNVAEKTISILIEQKLIDDQLFAETYVKQLLSQAKKGPKLINIELKSKGISEDIINSALNLYTESKQIDNIQSLINKKIKTINKSNREIINTLYNFLVSKGFDSELIKNCINELNETLPSEKLAFKKYIEKALRKYQNLEDKQRQKKIKEYMYRNGFNSDLINNYFD